MRIGVVMSVVLVASGVSVAAAGTGEEIAWGEIGTPVDLRVEVEEVRGPGIADRMDAPADHRIGGAGPIEIDGRVDDWIGADWIEMRGAPWHRGDNVRLDARIEKARTDEDAGPDSAAVFPGFRYAQMDPDAEVRYALDDVFDSQGVLVTAVSPGSPAAKAGLREGDVIRAIDGNRVSWAYQAHRWIKRARKATGSGAWTLGVQRNGRDRIGGTDDLSARIAFLYDAEFLYFAAVVDDDAHHQEMAGPEMWRNDSVQIGFDPTLARHDSGYGVDGHEIGVALQDDGPAIWRSHGRHAAPEPLLQTAPVAVVRTEGRTVYEIAVPRGSVAPMTPEIWSGCGVDVVINDSDGSGDRKGRLELCPLAMTRGKRPDEFATFKFAPPGERSAISLAWFWDLRLLPRGRAAFEVVAQSPEPSELRIDVRLEGWDGRTPRDVPPAFGDAVRLPTGPEPRRWRIDLTTRSQPAEYRVEWVASGPGGEEICRAGTPFRVYP